MRKLLLIVSLLLVAYFAYGQPGLKSGKLSQNPGNIMISRVGELPKKNQIPEISVEKKSGSTVSAAPISTFPWTETFESQGDWTNIDNYSRIYYDRVDNIEPISGSKYLMVAYNELYAQNVWTISPVLRLNAGTTYYFSVYAFCPGYEYLDEWKMTIGNSATSSAQKTVLIDKTGNNAESVREWKKFVASYTPATSGSYYVGINVCTPIKDQNNLYFEDFTVTTVAPTPEILTLGVTGMLWSTSTDNTAYAIQDESFLAYSEIEYSSQDSWFISNKISQESTYTADKNGVWSSILDEGNHSIRREAVGYDGVTKSEKEIVFNTKYPTNNTRDVVWNISNADRGESLTVNNVVEVHNYLSGMNSYYRGVCEKFTLPENVKVELNAFQVGVAYYKMSAVNQAKKVKIHIRKITDSGDPGSIIRSYEKSFADIFGTGEIIATTTFDYKIIELPQPLEITGSFCIEFDFSANTDAINSDNFLGLVNCNTRPVTFATTYVYYYNKWYASNAFWSNANISLAMQLDIKYVQVPDPLPLLAPESLSPQDNSKKASATDPLTVVFNRDIELWNNKNQISITPLGGRPVTYNARVEGNKLILDHTKFAYNTRYVVKIPAGAVKNYRQDISWYFTTQLDPAIVPNFVSLIPANEAQGVLTNVNVIVLFDKNISLGENNAQIMIISDQGQPVSNVIPSVSNSMLIITHDDFAYNTKYTVNIPADAVENYDTPIIGTFATMSNPNVGLNEFEGEVPAVYPNPSNGIVNVTSPENSVVKVLDVNGRVLENHNTTGALVLDLKYPDGLYFVRIEKNGESVMHKVVLKK